MFIKCTMSNIQDHLFLFGVIDLLLDYYRSFYFVLLNWTLNFYFLGEPYYSGHEFFFCVLSLFLGSLFYLSGDDFYLDGDFGIFSAYGLSIIDEYLIFLRRSFFSEFFSYTFYLFSAFKLTLAAELSIFLDTYSLDCFMGLLSEWLTLSTISGTYSPGVEKGVWYFEFSFL